MTQPTRLSIWILGDQLLDEHPALEYALQQESAAQVRVILVESRARAARQPYHRKKLVLLFSAMRHYADRLRERDLRVDYVHADTVQLGLIEHVHQHQPARLLTMAASEYQGRRFQQTQLAPALGIPVDVLPNTQFLTGQFDPFANYPPHKRTVMEFFYREMRRHFRVLMDGDEPLGSTWNFDKENRKSLPKNFTLPTIQAFVPDALTQGVMEEVAALPNGVGAVDDFGYAVTHEQARVALAQFIAVRLANFGPYEDAMTTRSPHLFHSILSPYVNIGLLTPLEMIRAAETAYHDGRAPLNSVEGFVRQVMGWREYMYWQYWRRMPGLAQANHWGAVRPVPEMLWTGETRMHCLKQVVQRIHALGYTHHIERLMILANFFTLVGVHPASAVEWFTASYIDAYDWVMQPNVVGMGLYADGGQIATKPYIASAAYINRMSDYCKGCVYNPKLRHGEQACPFNVLYWNFLIEHEAELRANPRMGQNVLALRHLQEDERQQIQAQAKQILNAFGGRNDFSDKRK